MIKSKAYEILSTFTKSEWQLFEHQLPALVDSKYKTIIPLFNYIQKHFSNGDESYLIKETCYKILFPNEPYEDKRMRYLLSYLKECIEHFLVYNNIHNDKLLYQKQLATELLKRGLLVSFKQENTQSAEILSKNPLRDTEYFFNKYQQEHLKLNYIAQSQNRNEKNNMEEVMIHLDKFYLAKKLQLASEVINIKNILATNYNTFMLDEIIQYLHHHEYADEPAIQVYLLIIKTLQFPEQADNYFALEALLLKNIQLFSLKELYEIYQYLQNYCIKKINLGDVTYQRKLFENYQTQINNDILIFSGTISQWDYKNIVTIALRLQEYEWAESFILTYKEHLAPSQKENAFFYNYANVLFRKGQYDKSLKMLQKVNMTDVYYKLDTRSMLLKTYYELNEIETLIYHAQAFKKFLRRDQIISAYQKEIYTNMITYVMKMQKAKGIKSKIKLIKKEIEHASKTADLAWLKEAITRL